MVRDRSVGLTRIRHAIEKRCTPRRVRPSDVLYPTMRTSPSTAAPRDGGKPLRVVSLVTHLYIGGDANRLLAFGRSVDRSRVDHSVLILVPPTSERDARYGPMRERFLEANIAIDVLGVEPRKERRDRMGWVRSRLLDARTAVGLPVRLSSYFREHEVDIVDARMNYAIFLGSLAGKLARVPAIVGTEYGTEFWRRGFWYAAGQMALHGLDALILDSQFKVDVYQTWLLKRHRRVEVIPNGIDPPRSSRTRAEMIRELGLPQTPETRIVGQISRLLPYKGHGVLIDAAKIVCDRAPNAAFLICGYAHPDPSYKGELIRRTEALGIADRVRVVSYPGPVADVWQAIDVHAHASLYDSSPIAIHESMALGLPAAVTDVGGIPELVEHQSTGLVVPAGDAPALAEAILRLLRDQDEAKRLGAAAQERFEQGYRAEVMANRLCDLFEDLLRNKPTRARTRNAHVPSD